MPVYILGPATLRRVPEVALAGSSASVDVDALPTLCFPSGIRLAASAGDCARVCVLVYRALFVVQCQLQQPIGESIAAC